MQYAAFVFAIFGFMAYLQQSSLQKRVAELERELTKMKGTSYADSREELIRAARSYIGQKVRLALKEDYPDADILMYGNTKHGSHTILDVDRDWLLVHIESPKTNKDKLIRLEALTGISAVNDEQKKTA